MKWIAGCVALLLSTATAAAQDRPPPSECLAIAQSLPRVMYASLSRVAANRGDVTITYAGHSTYVIETPGDMTIATDFSGAYTAGKSPNVVTMNRAHSTHYTLNPDPRIAHVLHGWGENGAACAARQNDRRRADPECHHRHPRVPVRFRGVAERRQFDLYL